jgi:Na+/melibiose symporter-like transporter
MTTAADPPLSTGRIIGYSAMMWPLVMAAASLPNFLPGYYSISLGLSLASIGIATMIGRLADIASDVTVSYLSDNTRSRFGRRRPWVVLGTPLFLFSMWRLFRPAATVTAFETIVLMLSFFWCWTAVLIPYMTQASEVTSNNASRNRINIMQGMFAAFAAMLPSLVVFIIADERTATIRHQVAQLIRSLDVIALGNFAMFLDQASAGSQVPYGRILSVTAIITVIAMPITLALYLWLAPDRPVPHHATREPASYTLALGNRVFHWLLAGNFFIQAGVYWYTALMPFLVSYVLQAPQLVVPLFLLSQIVAIGVAPLYPRLMDRVGRARAFALLACVPMLGTAASFFLQPGDHAAIYAIFIFTSMAGSPLSMLPFAVAADAAEYARWKQGKECTGIHVGLAGLTMKLALVATGGALWLASYWGFDPSKSTNPPEAIMALRVLATLVPTALLAVGCVLMLRFPLHKRRQQAIQSRLRRLQPYKS